MVITTTPERKTRKFNHPAYYDAQASPLYYLLPFRFFRLNAKKEILVNEVGDHIIVPTGTTSRIVSRNIHKHIDEDLYADLVSGFFISEEQIPPLLNVLATRYRTNKSFLDNFTSLHIFVITLRCEHTCHYCQVSRVSEDKTSFDMKRSHIDKGIDMMMRSPNPKVTMEFQGGEALLAFETITHAVRQAQEKAVLFNKDVTYVICTNLAPLTDEMLVFCNENNILISTSLDGPEDLHNRNRHKKGKDSYQLAVSGIERCRVSLGEDRVSALLTTSTLSLEFPNEIVEEYLERGFNSIFLRPISPFGFAIRNERKNEYDTNRFLDFYKTALNKIINYNLDGKFFREEYATIILRKILTPFPVGYVDLQSPSGMVNNVIVFNYDGKVYATDEARMLAEMNDLTFQIGDLETSTYEDIFYGDKVMAFSEHWSNEGLAGCSECAFQSYCGADPVLHHATQGDMAGYRPTSVYCQKNMEIIRYLFELIDSDERIAKVFTNWIG